jgi:4-hydroxy-tetrahydrodipicolinate synthase
MLVPALSLGANGSVCTVGNIIPEKVVEIYEEYKKGNYERAREVQLKILPIIDVLSVDPGAVKTALRILGYEVGTSPSPIINTPEEAKNEIEKALQAVGKI